LDRLVSQRIDLLERTAQLSRTGGVDAVRAVERESGLAISAQLRDLTGKMIAEEERLLKIRRQATDRSDWEETILFIAGGLTTILLLIWAYRIVQQYSRERDRAQSSVLQANQKLEGKIAQVDQLNQELESRVRARTADLERSNRDLQQFAYVASHDLQEPLRMVVSYVGLLRKSLQGKLDEDQGKYMAFASDGATRMQALISDLLTYARADSADATLVPTPLNDVVAQIRYSLLESIRETEAEIIVGPLPDVRVDGVKLGLVFQNLVSNAIKFRKSGQKPRVHIEAEEEAGEWTVAIRDEGIGFAPKYAEKIFDVFQRLHGGRQYPGTGIGLAICKRIVEGYGGRIWAESAAEAGATFFFTLPAVEGSLPATARYSDSASNKEPGIRA
jgi:signal transduction histidine kinase